MPSGENNFYLDDVDKGELHGEFVGNELVEFTRKMFPISSEREDTFIGGYGAMGDEDPFGSGALADLGIVGICKGLSLSMSTMENRTSTWVPNA